jgi:hypothetical protein
MAKKKVVKEKVTTPATPAPKLFISLEGQDVGQIKSIKVGETVELHVTGKVTGVSQSERDGGTRTGNIDLENYRVSVVEDEGKTNDFTKMAEDEETDDEFTLG